MKDSICKFNESIASAVNCTQFIYETSDIQQRTLKAATHLIGIVVKGGGSITLHGETKALSVGDIYVVKKDARFPYGGGRIWNTPTCLFTAGAPTN